MKMSLIENGPGRIAFFVLYFCCFFSEISLGQGNTGDVIHFYRSSGIEPLISSEQEGELPAGNYLIPHDILIPYGKSLTLFPGTKMFLVQNAMVVVNGSLVCSGISGSPVIFCKLANRDYYQPIDPRVETRWDGIYLSDSARLKMSNTIISDSKYGIVVSGKDVSMSFDSVRFVNNKFQNVKIGERIMKIAENSPVVFHYPEQQGVFVEPASVLNATESIQMKRGKRHRTDYPQLRLWMGVSGGLGVVMGGSGVWLYRKYSRMYEKTPQEDRYRLYVNAGRGMGVLGAILFGVGATGFVWTFFY